MTVFIDYREDIPIANAVKVDGLEADTGADFMLSRLSVPCKTRSLLDRHIDGGAILCQLKIGEDLASSVGDRLNDSLARMRSITKRTASHFLLFIGTIGCNNEGSATINGHRTHRNISFATLDGACIGWIARGGVYYALPRIEMLDGWAHAMERRLGEYDANQYHYAFNQQDMPDDLDEPLQIPVAVRDSRRVLIGFRGLGPNLVNRVWDYCGGDFKACLAFLTDPMSAGKVQDVGVKTIASIRRQCGLSDADGYFGWDRDAVDTDEIIRSAGKQVDTLLVKSKRSAEQVAADTTLLFGNKNGARR